MLATLTDGELVWLRWEAPGAPLLVFTTRRGGVSPSPYHTLNLGRSSGDDPACVAENRGRVLAGLGRAPARLVTAGQVHGAAVRSAAAPGHLPECDALVTTEPGLTLAVSAADCAPVLLWAPGAVAAVHAGWRGAAAGVVEAAARALVATARCDPRDLAALIGPCIRACCYRVGRDVAEQFDPHCLQVRDQATHLDLPCAVTLALGRAGVGQVHDAARCTSCEPAWFYSHRRDAGRTGRQWGVAALDDDTAL